MLNVQYDYCVANDGISSSEDIDGINEMWYVLSNNTTLCGAQHTTHDYTYRYVNDSTTMPRSYCMCGVSCLEPHVVESESFSGGNKYALCIVCKALVTIGMTHHQSIGTLPHSENGSFILPNGIIVLVDEDKEAYFNGTLEFIYPDNNLVTE